MNSQDASVAEVESAGIASNDVVTVIGAPGQRSDTMAPPVDLEQELSSLIPPAPSTVATLLLAIVGCFLAMAPQLMHYSGAFRPQLSTPDRPLEITLAETAAVDPDGWLAAAPFDFEGVVEVTIYLPFSNSRSVRVTDVHLTDPGAAVLSSRVTTGQYAEGSRVSQPRRPSLVLLVGVDGCSRPAPDEWGWLEFTIDFGDYGIPPWSRTVSADSPIWDADDPQSSRVPPPLEVACGSADG